MQDKKLRKILKVKKTYKEPTTKFQKGMDLPFLLILSLIITSRVNKAGNNNKDLYPLFSMERSRRRTSSCGMNYWSFFEVQECELNTHKKTDMAASCVTKLSVRGYLSYVPLILPSQPSFLLRRTPWARPVIYSSSSIWMVPLEGKGNENALMFSLQHCLCFSR